MDDFSQFLINNNAKNENNKTFDSIKELQKNVTFAISEIEKWLNPYKKHNINLVKEDIYINKIKTVQLYISYNQDVIKITPLGQSLGRKCVLEINNKNLKYNIELTGGCPIVFNDDPKKEEKWEWMIIGYKKSGHKERIEMKFNRENFLIIMKNLLS
ncbi:hypothetical protein MW350_004315 [Vibrio parahaemolyticus]|nr:hypothetical protein [Vibrio parahaemolyticus]